MKAFVRLAPLALVGGMAALMARDGLSFWQFAGAIVLLSLSLALGVILAEEGDWRTG